MKAPDKIYITPVDEITADGKTLHGFSSTYSFGRSKYEDEVEYIRKEALTEWAKECDASFQEQMDNCEATSHAHKVLAGGASTIEMLISFLESL